MIENCGEKTLTFELEQADLNFHLTVAVKVLTCQDCSCIRVLADQGSVLAQLSAAMHDPLPRWSDSVLNRKSLHFTSPRPEAEQFNRGGNRWHEEQNTQQRPAYFMRSHFQ